EATTFRARSRQASPKPSQLRTSSSRSVATSSNAWFMRATLRRFRSASQRPPPANGAATRPHLLANRKRACFTVGKRLPDFPQLRVLGRRRRHRERVSMSHAPTTREIGIIMNGVSGRMGYRQHLMRSILAIRDEGGFTLPDGTKITVRPLLVGRSEHK